MTEYTPATPHQFSPYTDFVKELATYQQGGEVLKVGELAMEALNEHHIGVSVMAEQIRRIRGEDSLDWLPYGYRTEEDERHLTALHELHYSAAVTHRESQGAEFIAKTLVASAGTHLVVTDADLLRERSVQAHLHLHEKKGVLSITELLTDDMSFVGPNEKAAAAAVYLAMEGINEGTDRVTLACPPAYNNGLNFTAPLFAPFSGKRAPRGGVRLVGAIPHVRTYLERYYGLTPSFGELRRQQDQQKS